MVERCYDQTGVHPGLIGERGDIIAALRERRRRPALRVGPLSLASRHRRGLVRQQPSLPENKPELVARTTAGKSRIQAKMDTSQDFFTNFYKNNPPEPNANRFSTICHQLGPAGARHELRSGLRAQLVHGEPGPVPVRQRVRQRQARPPATSVARPSRNRSRPRCRTTTTSRNRWASTRSCS